MRKIKCKCGCGEKLDYLDKWGRTREYISGHNARKYYGKDSGLWPAEQRWRAKNKDKLRDKKRLYYRERKLKAMLLLGNKCNICGVIYNGTNAPVFEFHHSDPAAKESGISVMLINKAWEKTLKELEKCVLICSNCHRNHHGGEW